MLLYDINIRRPGQVTRKGDTPTHRSDRLKVARSLHNITIMQKSTSLHTSSTRGFTLIELMVVIVIIGILATAGIANFLSLQNKARYASCISNQRSTHEAALIYSSDNNVGTVNVNVTVLAGAFLITQEVGECPSSANQDFDDYQIEFTNGDVTEIVCQIEGPTHLYEPQP